MKIGSVRSDLVVVGGGMAGICASIMGAREGCTVSLIERNHFWGGRAGFSQRFPLGNDANKSQVYSRDSGVMDELWHKLFRFNTEGTFIGQSRVLQDWIAKEDRIRCFKNTELESVFLEKGKIRAAVAKNHNLQELNAFHGKYYLDCTGTGKIAELCDIPGEKGVDKKEKLPSKKRFDPPSDYPSCSCFIRIEKGVGNYPFECPDWVKIMWEDNHFTAQVNLMKSLQANLTGEHLLEWEGISNEKNLSPEVISLAAWDYLKNRSSISDVMQSHKLVHISEKALPMPAYRSSGTVRLGLDDLFEGKEWYDSVALGSASIANSFSLLSCNRDELPLSKPFEIPLRAMISNECKNLLLAGSSSSASELTSRTLGHPSCASQMGSALGMIASLCIRKKRLPKTLADKSYMSEISRFFYRRNHASKLDNFEDDDNLACKAKIKASSTLEDCLDLENKVDQIIETKSCRLQFPVTTNMIHRLSVQLLAQDNQIFTVKILEGSGYNKSNPGVCLFSGKTSYVGNIRKLKINCELEIEHRAWHFLELESDDKFKVPLYANGLIGFVLHDQRKKEAGEKRKFFSEFEPILPYSPHPAASPKIEVTPRQQAFLPSNTSNYGIRPNQLPNLWASKPTDFKYPEFLEFEWEELQNISDVEISFDPAYDFIYPSKPASFNQQNFSSLVKDYRIYALGDDGASSLIADIQDNQVALRTHSFEPFYAKGLEIEIISTHGLNRAQIYQVRIYA